MNYAHMHTYLEGVTHICVEFKVYLYIYAGMSTFTHPMFALTHTCPHLRRLAYMYAYFQADAHTCTYWCIYAHRYLCMSASTHICTDSHTGMYA